MRRDRCRRAQGMSLSLPLSICQLGSRIGNSRDYGFSTLEKYTLGLTPRDGVQYGVMLPNPYFLVSYSDAYVSVEIWGDAIPSRFTLRVS